MAQNSPLSVKYRLKTSIRLNFSTYIYKVLFFRKSRFRLKNGKNNPEKIRNPLNNWTFFVSHCVMPAPRTTDRSDSEKNDLKKYKNVREPDTVTVGSNLSFMILDFMCDFVFKTPFRFIFEVFNEVIS